MEIQNRMSYEEFAPLFGKWATKFRPFIESEDMYNIYQKLKQDTRFETIVPNSGSTFRTFSTTDPENIKVIFYLMDPYPRQYKKNLPQATGIAMDCSNAPDGKCQPSLEKFYGAMEKEMDRKIQHSPSLQYLQEQGVMMLNTDLTCKLNKTGSHEGLWLPFQKYFLQEVMSAYSGIIYVLCGKQSHKMEKYIMHLGNYVFKLDHPASAAHNRTDWDSKGIFTLINRLISQNNGEGYQIMWDKSEFDNLPF